MSQINISELESAITSAEESNSQVTTGMTVSPMPDPYVPPPFQLLEGTLHAEVLIIKAPAAVGKSITARYLSAKKNAPFLNLAKVAVGTGSLQGLVSDYRQDGRQAFHSGQLPIIVDALDEGRLLSGDNSLEAFLSSAVAFLQTDRSTSTNPKLVLLGREESAELSQFIISVEDQNITTATLRMDFFGKDAATELIDLYARRELKRLHEIGDLTDEDYGRRGHILVGEPMKRLKDAYFSAIERALEVQSGYLWTENRGRTFAGYAPVLASIGTLLASVNNPIVVTNRLTAANTREAWEVIDTVIQEILQREKSKLTNKLVDLEVVPENAYDPNEQLYYLVQILGDCRSLTPTRSVRFNNERDSALYMEKVSQLCEEHPFIRSRKMANEVLGARIFAHAICDGYDLGEPAHISSLRSLSNGPFLWRSTRRELLTQCESILDGKFIGYILNSFWNDPMEKMSLAKQIRLEGTREGFVKIVVGNREDKAIVFSAIPPVFLYGSMRDCEIVGEELNLVMEGATLDSSSSSSLFRFHGNNRVLCNELTYKAKSMEIGGSLWLHAATVIVSVPNPEVHVRGICEYGWGGEIRNSEPWKKLTRGTLSDPYHESLISRLFSDCERNIPANGIVLMDDYSLPVDDPVLMSGQPHIKLLSHQYLTSIVIIEPSPDALLPDTDFRILALEKIHRHMPNHSDIMGCIASTNPALIFTKRHVQSPMQSILDPPMRTHRLVKQLHVIE